MRKRPRLQSIRIVKASGEHEPFSEEKLRQSLVRSGARPVVIDEVVRSVVALLRPGMTTKALYRIAHQELKRAARPVAARYGLRRAMMDLGPTGFPFERLVAALLEYDGYTTRIDVPVRGRCVMHEIDVVAERNAKTLMAECKYHNQPGGRTDIKVALYVQARATDVRESFGDRLEGFCLITNTKFTTEAVEYGACVGLTLLGWNHPVRHGVEERLQRTRLFPVTCLVTLRRYEKQALLEAGIVSTQQLSDRPAALGAVGVTEADARRVLKEIELLHDGSEKHQLK